MIHILYKDNSGWCYSPVNQNPNTLKAHPQHILLDPPCRLEKYPALPRPTPPKGRDPLISPWPQWPSSETLSPGTDKGDSCAPRPPTPPTPREHGHLQGRGQIKCRRKREIEASPVGGFPHYDRRKAPIFRPPGAPPRAHWPPLALSRAPRPGVSVAAAWLPEAAAGEPRQPERAAGWAHLGRAERFPIVNKEREISPSAGASADTQSYWGWREGGEKMPFLPPGEYLGGLYVVCERGILGGQERKGRGLWGEGREDSPSTSSPRGLI